jgi:hypothetical protein
MKSGVFFSLINIHSRTAKLNCIQQKQPATAKTANNAL